MERAAVGGDADNGRVRDDYISTFTGEIGRQPTYEEYAHIMTGCTPEQLPVLNGIARDSSGCSITGSGEVPSQNRS